MCARIIVYVYVCDPQPFVSRCEDRLPVVEIKTHLLCEFVFVMSAASISTKMYLESCASLSFVGISGWRM
jgi:hypothetical protein